MKMASRLKLVIIISEFSIITCGESLINGAFDLSNWTSQLCIIELMEYIILFLNHAQIKNKCPLGVENE